MFRSKVRLAAMTAATALLVAVTGAGAITSATAVPTATAQVAVDRSDERGRDLSMSPRSGGVAESKIVTLKGKGAERVTEVRFGSELGTILPPEATTNGDRGDRGDGRERVRVQAPTGASVEYQPTEVPVVAITDGRASFVGMYSYVVESGVDHQLNYAFTYWRVYNDERYLSFNPYGGDCMDFVSQTLAARGLPADVRSDGWYNDFGPGDSIDNWKEWTTPAWISVSNFDRYITTKQAELGLELFDLFELDRSQLAIGDVVLFEWVKGEPTARPDSVDEELWNLLDFDGDHAMIVSDLVHYTDGEIGVKLAGHNADADFVDLDYILATRAVADGHIWHFTD